MTTDVAFVALGANLGDPVQMLSRSVRSLYVLHRRNKAGTEPPEQRFAVSGLYRSAPFQADGPDYYNAVVRLVTDIGATALLTHLQTLETAGGRIRSTLNAPRTLDLDLLLYGNETRTSEWLTLPHPRMHERAFVLRPLLDLGAAALEIPGHGPVSALEVHTRAQTIVKIPSPWMEWDCSGPLSNVAPVGEQ